MDERNVAFGWDDEITEDGKGGFTVLPEGDYEFEVVTREKSWYDGGSKIPACNMAKLELRFTGAAGSTTIKENFHLHSKMEWKLSALFGSIGLKKKGEPLKMDWNKVVGAKGWAHLYVDTYLKDGNERQSNKVKYFIYKEDAPVSTDEAIKTTFGGGMGW
jgi:hypothetical protein